MAYLIRLSVLIMARVLDLFLTWLVTPDLSRERNPIVRWLDWPGNLMVNPPACALAAVWPLSTWFLVGASLWASAVNFRNWFLLHKRGKPE